MLRVGTTAQQHMESGVPYAVHCPPKFDCDGRCAEIG